MVPVASAHKLYEALGSRRKHLKIFTAEDGGVYHAQADNRQVGVDYIADWIDGHAGRVPPGCRIHTPPAIALNPSSEGSR